MQRLPSQATLRWGASATSRKHLECISVAVIRCGLNRERRSCFRVVQTFPSVGFIACRAGALAGRAASFLGGTRSQTSFPPPPRRSLASREIAGLGIRVAGGRADQVVLPSHGPAPCRVRSQPGARSTGPEARDESPGTERWADLLVCEQLASQCVPNLPGLTAARSSIHRFSGRTFLEVERFDRHGAHGRSALCSWAAINNAWFGLSKRPWSEGAQRLVERGLIASETRDAITASGTSANSSATPTCTTATCLSCRVNLA